jgi:hypothetical protein
MKILAFAILAALYEVIWNASTHRRGAVHDGIATLIYALAGFSGGLAGGTAFGVVLGLTTAAFDATVGLVLWVKLGGKSFASQPAPPLVLIGAITLWGGLVAWVAGVGATLTPWAKRRE